MLRQHMKTQAQGSRLHRAQVRFQPSRGTGDILEGNTAGPMLDVSCTVWQRTIGNPSVQCKKQGESRGRQALTLLFSNKDHSRDKAVY